jgi:hypothetical protein
LQNLFAALGSDDESDSRPVVKSTPSKPEPKSVRSENPAARGARGADRGDHGGRGRGASRGGRGRGGSRGYSNEDGISLLYYILIVAFKERDEVLANRERNADEPRPRGGRGGRGGGGGRGREHDRHSATGRVYVLHLT